ncbi:MAG: DUF1571 domain-containing protein [Candidatus Omnitrophica bacterium]|nr:DUF1571 domain-containing protein [Candidatus Omnitrophota bacterium]
MRQRKFQISLALVFCFLLFSGLKSPEIPNIKKEIETITNPITKPIKSTFGIRRDPIEYILQMSKAYEKVQDYTAVFMRQETREGKLQDEEKIQFAFKRPFAISMKWLDGPGKGRDLFYVEGQNDGKILVNPGGLLGALVSYVRIDADGPMARKNSTRSIKQAGLGNAIASILQQTLLAKERKELQVVDHGERELEGRVVHFVERILPQDPVYQNHRLLLWIDKSTGLPVKIMLYNWDDVLTESYFYSSLKINVGLTDDDFLPPSARKAPKKEEKREPLKKEIIEDVRSLLKKSLEVYNKLEDYSATFIKEERVKGKLNGEAELFVKFRKPFSVYIREVRGNNRYTELVYVKDQNDNKIIAHPKGSVGYVLSKAYVDPEGVWAMAGNRHPITEFGIEHILDLYNRDFERGVSSDEVDITSKGIVDIEGEEARQFELILTNKVHKDLYYAPKTIIAFSTKSFLPIDIQVFDEKNNLLEHYRYLDLRIDNKFEDIDFDSRNPNYKF